MSDLASRLEEVLGDSSAQILDDLETLDLDDETKVKIRALLARAERIGEAFGYHSG